MRRILLLTFAFICISVHTSMACTGGLTDQGGLTPTAAYQTQATEDGDYYTISVSCGNTYHFDFCNNGGTQGSLFGEITILDATGTTEHAFAGWGGTCTELTWTATFTGTIRLLITDSGCGMGGGWTGTFAYNVTGGGPIDTSFSLTATGCTSSSATVTGTPGGTFTFNPNPGDGAILDANTGGITNGTTGTTYFVQYSICGNNETNSVVLPAGDASFTLSTTCGGATANITGDTGGTFAFNPVPGDGAQINTSTGAVSNGTVGTTYTVEYTVCGTSTTQAIQVLNDNCFTLGGNAQYVNINGEDCIQLTPELNAQTGCAWNSTQIDFNSDFTLTLDYYFGDNFNGADGNTFAFQPSSSTACGTNGQQMGGGGMPNSLIVEFDTYDNDNPAHIFDMVCDHIAVEIDGDMSNAAPHAGPVCAKASGADIDDGGTYQVDIAWNATTLTLDIYFDGALRLSTSGTDFVNTVFGGQNMVYWGATAATGGLNNQQYFCPSTIVILPAEMTSFTSICEEKSERFEWTTASENRVDYFQLEYSHDGLVYIPVSQVDAMGDSQEENTYSVSVTGNSNQQRYYRLKVVDEDGAFEYSDMIQSKMCHQQQSLISSIAQGPSNVNIGCSELSSLEIRNQLGQLVYSNQQAKSHQLSTDALPNGIYYAKANGMSGRTESCKFAIVK